MVISTVVSRVEVPGTDSGLNPLPTYFIWGSYGQKYWWLKIRGWGSFMQVKKS